MHIYEVMAEPIRRRIIELLASGTHGSGIIIDVITSEFGVSDAAVSHHLRVLREHGAVRADWDWPYRMYELSPNVFRELGKHYNRMLFFWRRRIGGRNYPDPLEPSWPEDTRRGWRGHGMDPDWPPLQQLRSPK